MDGSFNDLTGSDDWSFMNGEFLSAFLFFLCIMAGFELARGPFEPSRRGRKCTIASFQQ